MAIDSPGTTASTLPSSRNVVSSSSRYRRRVESKRRDQALREAAYHALHNSGYRALGRLHCQASGGTLVVTGVVPSFYLKQLAQEVIKRLDDVSKVVNRIDVSTQAAQRAATP